MTVEAERMRPAATRRRKRRQLSWRSGERVVLALGGVVAFGLLLEIIARYVFANPDYVPPLSQTLGRFLQLFTEPRFYEQVWDTLSGFLVGIVIATVLGIALGTLFGLWEISYRSTRTVIEMLRPIPAVALIPLAIVLFGTNLGMKTIIVVLASIWPIMFNALYGVRNVDPLMKEMARSFGRSRIDVVRSVVIPAALPMMWAGVRVSSTISLIVVITLELYLGGSAGIGGMIAEARAGGNDVLSAYAAIVVAGLLGLLVNILLGVIERRFFSWSTTTKEG
ncbi:ABC transporter permease [Herbiconiux sp. UC225_62]|uniref:ABC transporter permease n=1 Tax=Herbiconiux sp. UC225_62 TaxID=3350168 RepID=UPI0036D2B7E3